MTYETIFCKLATRNSQLATRNSQLATAIVVSSTLLLTACGGGEGDTRASVTDVSNNKPIPNSIPQSPKPTQPKNPSVKKQRGQFIDSAVGNVAVYQNGKKVATTDSEGYFDYTKGSKVTFKVGKLILGSTMPKAIITPADLACSRKDVVEILQALQSLDEDHNPDNGIYIPQVTLDKLVTTGDLSDKKVSLADTIQKDIPNIKIVDEKKAVDHFAKAPVKIAEKIADDLVGYWYDPCNVSRGSVTSNIKEVRRVSNSEFSIKIQERTFADNNTNCSGKWKKVVTGTGVYKVKGSYLDKNGKKHIYGIFEIDDGRKRLEDIVVSADGKKTNNSIRHDGFYFPTNVASKPVEQSQADKSVGYWKSTCMNSRKGSKRYYLNIVKQDDGSFLMKQSLSENFTNASCSGKRDLSVTDSQGTLIPTEYVNKGVWEGDNRFIITHDDGYTETYDRISVSDFPSH